MYYSILGDSISTFYGQVPENYAVFYTWEAAMYNGLSSVKDIWWYRVLGYLGADLLIDAAYSGGRVSGIEFPAANTYERILALKTSHHEPDGILVYIGYNDFGYGVPLRSETSETDSLYFYNAYSIMLKRLREIYPSARIICSTLMPTYILFRPDWKMPMVNKAGLHFDLYNDAIRSACIECDVELVDAAVSGIRCDSLDGAHGTKQGHKELAEAWIRYLSDSCES